MSDWTHVAGIIRLDHLPLLQLGGPLSESTVEMLVRSGSPRGSEGGLDIKVVKTQVMTPTGGPLVWGWISFTGDLRDFGPEDSNIIFAWLSKFSKELVARKAIIRQGIVAVEIESEDHERVYSWHDDHWEEKAKP